MILVALLGCSPLLLPHDGVDATFPLTGGHLIPCATCHGEGTPKAQPTACVNCHAQEVLPPGHTADTACEGCHVIDGWGVGVLTGPPIDTGTVPTIPTVPTDSGTTPTGPSFDHSGLGESTECASCHEIGASNPYRPEGHNLGADCGPCHTPTQWTNDPIQHPAPTPHGGSVVACSECHPSGPPGIDCVTCHLADKLLSPHNGFGPTSTPPESLGCLNVGCHPDATSPL